MKGFDKIGMVILTKAKMDRSRLALRPSKKDPRKKRWQRVSEPEAGKDIRRAKLKGLQFEFRREGNRWKVYHDGIFVDSLPAGLPRERSRDIIRKRTKQWANIASRRFLRPGNWTFATRERRIGFGQYANRKWSDPEVSPDYLYWLAFRAGRSIKYDVPDWAPKMARKELDYREQQFQKRRGLKKGKARFIWHPGIRGGTFYIDRQGKVRYGRNLGTAGRYKVKKVGDYVKGDRVYIGRASKKITGKVLAYYRSSNKYLVQFGTVSGKRLTGLYDPWDLSEPISQLRSKPEVADT
ncbi:MAG: hypothetical protein V3U24_05715 [Candidatus Neomarinimicrobiota bacterium]